MCTFPCVFYLAKEVSLLLSVGEAGQVATDHQVRVIQHRIEPTSGGQKGLNTQDTLFTALEYTLTDLPWKLSQLYLTGMSLVKTWRKKNAISMDRVKISGGNKINMIELQEKNSSIHMV